MREEESVERKECDLATVVERLSAVTPARRRLGSAGGADLHDPIVLRQTCFVTGDELK